MFSRRDLIHALGLTPFTRNSALGSEFELRFRLLGRTGHSVVPLALGGQGSLQWTPPGIDAPDIVVRAVELGVNYLDTANAYGPSQANYGTAFRRLHLTPDDPEYNAALREYI
ncbi:MAG: aldo/keto reductase [bacterium]|nr:aldo/keto reductase [bacterium]